MRKITVLCAAICFAISGFGQQLIQPREIHNSNGSIYKKCYYVKETKSLCELAEEQESKNAAPAFPHPAADGDAHANFNRTRTQRVVDENQPLIDSARQSVDGTEGTVPTIENFDGQPSVTGTYPLDPNGMVSTLYYVQTVNSTMEVWNKNGTVKMNHTDLKNLFGSRYGDGDCGDPVVLYDKTADRWIITEFEGCENNFDTNDVDTLLMAVSKTNDPTGQYWIYAFDPYRYAYDDYPKYHVWGDGYYMTCNCQNPDMIVAYQRDSMLVGASAGMIVMPWNLGPKVNGCSGNFFCPMMLDADGTLPPFGSPEYLFYYWDNSWGCGGADSICIEQVSINWTHMTGSINGNYQHLITSAFNSNFPVDFDANIPQPGNVNSQRLASGDGFFSYRIPYLRWSSYNSCVMVNPVNVGTMANPVAGLRWYELRQDTTTKLWSIYQQSTWAPNDGVSRWMGSIAMNYNGDIALAYSVTDKTSTYPGLRYTGRKYCDPINGMTLAEGTAVSGNALIRTSQGNGNRWGDYCTMAVDPSDGTTFWYTNMYSKNGASFSTNMQTRIFSYNMGACHLGVNEVSEPTAKLTAYQNGGNLIVKGTGIKTGERVVIELFDENGKRLMQKEMTPGSSDIETAFNVSSLAKALYIVRLGNDSFQRVVKLVLN